MMVFFYFFFNLNLKIEILQKNWLSLFEEG